MKNSLHCSTLNTSLLQPLIRSTDKPNTNAMKEVKPLKSPSETSSPCGTFRLTLTIIAGLLLLIGLPASQAASLTFAEPIVISGDTDVVTNLVGTRLFAYTRGYAATVNGTPFTYVNWNPPNTAYYIGTYLTTSGFTRNQRKNFQSLEAPYNTLSPAYTNILVGAMNSDTLATTASLILTNLTVGHTYFFQFWVQDPRASGAAYAQNVSSGGGPTVTMYFNSTVSEGGLGQYTYTTFTADASTQEIVLDTLNLSPPYTGAPAWNAAQLWDVTAIAPVYTSAWIGGSTVNGNWSDPQNWDSNGVPGSTSGPANSTDRALFSGPTVNGWGSASTPIVIDGASWNIGGLLFSSTADDYVIGTTSGNALRLSSDLAGGIGVTSGALGVQTVNSPIVLEPSGNTNSGNYVFNTTNTGSINIAGNVSGGTTTAGVTLELRGELAGTNTLSGIISDGGAAQGVTVTRSAGVPQSVWVISGANTYSGGTIIRGGQLVATHSSALGTGSVTVPQGGGLGLMGGITVEGQPLSFGGTYSSMGALQNVSGDNTYGGPITLGAGGSQGARVTSVSGNLFLTNRAVINYYNGNAVVFTMMGAGNITLDADLGEAVRFVYGGTGTGTYRGTSFSTNTVTVQGGGTLALSGNASIAHSSSIVVASNSTFDVSALVSTFALGGSQTLSNSTSTALLKGDLNASLGSVSLVFADGSPSLSISEGTLTLSSANTFKINNTGAALAAGSYLLIATGSGGAVAGSLPAVTVGGAGVVSGEIVSLRTHEGQLYLVVGTPQPVLSDLVINGTTLTVKAAFGAANATAVLLESLNLAAPIHEWVPVLTNQFDASGNLTISADIIDPAAPRKFYMLSQ